MRRNSFLVLFMFISLPVFSNDALIRKSSSSVTIMEPDSTMIRMEKEYINIHFFIDHYEVECFYFFKNYGDFSIKATLGFPIWVYNKEEVAIYDFTTKVNGYKKDFELIKNDEIEDLKNTGWYVKSVDFPQNEIVTTSVKYSCNYDGRVGTYLFGSGAPWFSTIGEINLQVEVEPNVIVLEFKIKNEENDFLLERVNDNTRKIILKNIEPDLNAMFIFRVVEFDPINRSIPTPSIKRFYLSNNKLKKNEIAFLTSEQALYWRYMILATKGKIFKDRKIMEIFQNESWYIPDPNFTFSLLSDIEKYNYILLGKVD